MIISAPPSIELVLLTESQEDELEDVVRRLMDELPRRVAGRWIVTIADLGSTDDTPLVAARMARSIEGVRAIALEGRIDRKALRARWESSPAEVVAFVEAGAKTDWEQVLAPLAATPRPEAMEADTGGGGWSVTRRTALIALGGIGATALLAACGSSAKTNASASTTSTTNTTATSTKAVTLAPEMTEGPYYLDLNLVRSDITEDRTGGPMTLTLTVVNAAGAPISGAAVDIWHCDANGLYSGFVSQSASANQGGSGSNSDSGTFLRGTQVSDASGKVTFKTVYPGWYQGRTVHIHVKVHASGRVVHTGQLFFDDAFTDSVYASVAPYSSRSARTTRNTSDGIYSGGGSQSILNVQKSGSSFAASMTMAVRA